MWQPRCGWVWDEGPGVQVASAPRLSTEQDLGCTAITAQYGAGFEAQGWGHGAAWHGHHSNLIVLGLGAPHSVPKMSGLYQAAEHPLPEPSLWLQWDAGSRVPGGSGGFAHGTDARDEEHPVQGPQPRAAPSALSS